MSDELRNCANNVRSNAVISRVGQGFEPRRLGVQPVRRRAARPIIERGKQHDQSRRARALFAFAGCGRVGRRDGLCAFLPAPGARRPLAATAPAAVGIGVWALLQLGRRFGDHHSADGRLHADAVRRRPRVVATACHGGSRHRDDADLRAYPLRGVSAYPPRRAGAELAGWRPGGRNRAAPGGRQSGAGCCDDRARVACHETRRIMPRQETPLPSGVFHIRAAAVGV
jgi:hypothetical protein